MKIVRCDGDPIWGEGEAGALWKPRPLVFDDLGFAARYAVEVLPEADPEEADTIHLPRKWRELPWDPGNGIVLRIRDAGGRDRLVAVRAEYRFSGFVEGLFGSPDPDVLLVGLGNFLWRIPASDPDGAACLSPYPTGIVALPENDLLAVVDNSWIQGYGPRGPLWESEQIALDGIRLLSLEGTVLHMRCLGSGMVFPDEGFPCRLDLRTGESWGGWGGAGEAIPLDAPRGAPPARTFPPRE